MCGRYQFASPIQEAGRWFDLASIAPVPPNDNAAPTQNLAVIARGPDGRLHSVAMQWGLVPSWAEAIDGGARMINARSETVFEKPSFRYAVAHNPCVVPANAFYEWKRADKAKQPYKITWPGHPLFFFLGIWDVWKGGGAPLYSFAILTRAANPSLEDLHERMPIMVDGEQAKRWLLHDKRHATLDHLSYESAQVTYAAEPVDAAINRVQGAPPPRQRQLF
jgi:putative SOS response-associated peptidase YedK